MFLMSHNFNIEEHMSAFGIETNLTDFNKSHYHIICIPYAETVSYLQGTEQGPRAIFKASEQVELYDIETQSEPYLKGISHSEIDTSLGIQDIWKQTSNQVKHCLDNKKFPVILGGEHTVSHGAIMACNNYYDDLTIIQIDAHSDLKEQYLGNPYSHACALRYAYNLNIPIVQLGIRSLCPEEHKLIKNNPDKVSTFFANRESFDLNAVIESINTKNLYITIDLDGFDPSVIRDVGTPEPGGLQWYEVIELLEVLFKKFNVTGADIVELCPNKFSTPSDFAAAKLLYKLFSLKQ